MEEADLEPNGNSVCQNLSSRLHGSMKQPGFNRTNTTKIEGNKTKAIFFRDKTSLMEKLNFSSKLETYILLLITEALLLGLLHLLNMVLNGQVCFQMHLKLDSGSPSPPELGFQLTSINQSIVFKCFK